MEENNSLPALPKSWVWTALGGVIDSVKGKKPKNLGPRDERLAIPYVTIKGFEHKVFDQFTDGDGCRLCKPEDVLIVWDGARCGLVGRGASGAIGSTLAMLVCYELAPSYLYYFLQSQYAYINTRPKGIGIPHIAPEVLWTIPFPMPGLPEQHRIVAKIETQFTRLDAGVAALKRAQANLKRYRASVLKAACAGRLVPQDPTDEPADQLLARILAERRARWEAENPGKKYKEPAPPDVEGLPELPEGWMWGSVAQLAENIQYGYTESAKEEPIGPKFLRITDIQDGRVNWDTVPYCECSEKKHSKYRLEPGDIVFARTGATTGKSYLIIDPPDAVFASYLIRLQVGKSIDAKYLALFFGSPLYWPQIMSVKKGSAQPGVNATILATLHVPLPPLPEQRRIVAEVERRLSVVAALEREVEAALARAARLRQSILKRAFEGRLVPQDPDDEPAAVLLARIKRERERKEKRRSGPSGLGGGRCL